MSYITCFDGILEVEAFILNFVFRKCVGCKTLQNILMLCLLEVEFAIALLRPGRRPFKQMNRSILSFAVSTNALFSNNGNGSDTWAQDCSMSGIQDDG